jgi:hypothetical protein
MLQQVLNEGFATDAMRFVAEELQEVVDADEAGRPLRDGRAGPRRRHRARYAPVVEHAFIPRDVALSIVQSGLEELFYEQGQVVDAAPATRGARRAAPPLPAVTDERIERVPVPT